jgi:hypothetical protein
MVLKSYITSLSGLSAFNILEVTEQDLLQGTCLGTNDVKYRLTF